MRCQAYNGSQIAASFPVTALQQTSVALIPERFRATGSFVRAGETKMIWLKFSVSTVFEVHGSSLRLPRAWSALLHTDGELFCFTGSHLAEPHKHPNAASVCLLFHSFDVPTL